MKYMLLAIDWSFFDKEFMGEKVSNYMWCLGIIIFTLLLKKPLATGLSRISNMFTQRFSDTRQRKRVARTMLRSPLEKLIQVILYYIAVNQLSTLLDNLAFNHS